jgi:hypothetical protein
MEIKQVEGINAAHIIRLRRIVLLIGSSTVPVLRSNPNYILTPCHPPPIR